MSFTFKGIGFAQLIIVFLGNVYYEVILAWTLRYLFDSFSFNLPWKSCANSWNSECCSEKLLYGKNYSKQIENHLNMTKTTQIAIFPSNYNNTKSCNKLVDPITEYWE